MGYIIAYVNIIYLYTNQNLSNINRFYEFIRLDFFYLCKNNLKMIFLLLLGAFLFGSTTLVNIIANGLISAFVEAYVTPKIAEYFLSR